MTREGSPKGGAEQPVEEASLRRPYRTPQLRHLGSVRELTLGGSKGSQEDGGTFMASMMGM